MNVGLPLVSIIIPVYKVEDYLRICVDSVLNQSFRDYEIILVDDGSPDGCPGICDEYAASYDCVKVMHKKNGGLSDARNSGILIAAGQYLLFLDSDDFIADGSLEKISQTVKSGDGADIIFLNALCLYPDGKEKCFGTPLKKETFYHKSKGEILRFLAEGPQFHVSACLKLVKRELIIGNEIWFTKGLLSEDVDWSLKLYLHGENFDCCEFTYYCYRQQREGSIMSVFSEKRFSDILFIISKWLPLSSDVYKDYEDIIHFFLYHQYYALVLMYGNKNNKNRRKYRAALKELSWFLDLTKSRKAFLVKMFYRLFGLRFLSAALRFYLKMENSHGQ